MRSSFDSRQLNATRATSLACTYFTMDRGENSALATMGPNSWRKYWILELHRCSQYCDSQKINILQLPPSLVCESGGGVLPHYTFSVELLHFVHSPFTGQLYGAIIKLLTTCAFLVFLSSVVKEQHCGTKPADIKCPSSTLWSFKPGVFLKRAVMYCQVSNVLFRGALKAPEHFLTSKSA